MCRGFAAAFSEFVRAAGEVLPECEYGQIRVGAEGPDGPDELAAEAITALNIDFTNGGGEAERVEDAAVTFGRIAWRVMHALPYRGRPDKCGSFARAAVAVFPCAKCRKHAQSETVIETAIDRLCAATTVEDAAIQTFLFHNAVTRNVTLPQGFPSILLVQKECFHQLEAALERGTLGRSTVALFLKSLWREPVFKPTIR